MLIFNILHLFFSKFINSNTITSRLEIDIEHFAEDESVVGAEQGIGINRCWLKLRSIGIRG